MHADDSLSLRPATKVGAIVSGQTSVKAPERDAFEKYLPKDVHIISIHSLHGPTVAPDGQALVCPSFHLPFRVRMSPDWTVAVR